MTRYRNKVCLQKVGQENNVPAFHMNRLETFKCEGSRILHKASRISDSSRCCFSAEAQLMKNHQCHPSPALLLSHSHTSTGRCRRVFGQSGTGGCQQ
uniref:Uncharacterized protein n=1 Tax=Knipowitschia caucasica TaxID=637954 RepID=A0AAV2LGG8_KNICA